MLPRSLVRTFAILAVAAAPLLAQDATDTRPQGQPAAAPVRGEMEKVEAALEVVAKYVETFTGDAPLAQLDVAQEGLQEAKQHTPRTAARQPEEQREAFVKAYRVAVNRSIRALLDLEDAIIAKDKDAAKKALAEVQAAQKAGHEKYKGRRGAR